MGAVARVSKPPHERRDELLDAAQRLCVTVGYDALSIEQLTRDAGVAKGTFYYHFAAKTDMLAALVQRFVDALFEDLDAAASGLTGTGAERFRHLLTHASAWKTARLDDALTFVPLLFKPENGELRHRLFDAWHDQARHLFRPAIALGLADGSFDIEDADAAALTDVVLSLWLDSSARIVDRALTHDSPERFADTLVTGTTALMTAAERVLGAPPGSFAVPFDRSLAEHLHAPLRAALHREPAPVPTTRSTR